MKQVCAVLLTLIAAGPALADDRCARGPEAAKRGDLTRALIYLEGCEDEASTKLARDLKKKARDADYAELSVVSDPDGVAFELSTVPGETFTTPSTVFLKPGTNIIKYTVGGNEFQKIAETKAYSRSAVLLDAVVKQAGTPKDGKVSFEDEGTAADTQIGPPPDVKRRSLMKDKYIGVVGPAGPQLEDPLALTAQHGAKPWFGARLGGGYFDDSATDATLRPTVAVTARIPLVDRVFLSARLDWSRRGGTASDSVDAAGVNIGAGYTFVANHAIALAAIVQLRGELHFADTRDAMSVSRGSAGASGGLELAIARTPLTVGVRGETGFTELVPDARDRAMLVELGVDWR